MKYCGNQVMFTRGMDKKESAVQKVYEKVLMPRDQESSIMLIKV